MMYLQRLSRTRKSAIDTDAPNLHILFANSQHCENYAKLLADFTWNDYPEILSGFLKTLLGFPVKKPFRCWFLLTSSSVALFEKFQCSPLGKEVDSLILDRLLTPDSVC